MLFGAVFGYLIAPPAERGGSDTNESGKDNHEEP
jgi:hypothetical protein